MPGREMSQAKEGLAQFLDPPGMILAAAPP